MSGPGNTSLKSFAAGYLCAYAVSYPLIAHICMSDEGGEGSVPVQIFQALTLLAALFFGRFGRRSIEGLADVWTIATVYFAGAACCFATLYAQNEKVVEIAYACRFIFWFIYASLLARGSFEPNRLRNLAVSFWIGAVIQGILAAHAYATRGVESIYGEVYATTGSASVSGKTVAAFSGLGVFLSCYWLFRRRMKSPFYRLLCFGAVALGMFVIYASYNRAAQLSLAIVCCWGLAWLYKTGRIKSALLFTFLLCVAGLLGGIAFSESTFVQDALIRWSNVYEDGGSGRDKLLRAAIRNLMEPDSLSSLFFGRGYHHTRELMFEACGAYIGTHSDLFDFLTSYGLVGGLFYFAIIWRILSLKDVAPRKTREYFFIRCSTIYLVLIGLFTGMFQGTYAYLMLFTLCYYWRSEVRFQRRRGMRAGECAPPPALAVSFEIPEQFPEEEFEDQEETGSGFVSSFSALLSGKRAGSQDEFGVEHSEERGEIISDDSLPEYYDGELPQLRKARASCDSEEQECGEILSRTDAGSEKSSRVSPYNDDFSESASDVVVAPTEAVALADNVSTVDYSEGAADEKAGSNAVSALTYVFETFFDAEELQEYQWNFDQVCVQEQEDRESRGEGQSN